MSFITLIVVISILVFVHELGHFLMAKKSGIRVDEFSIGFPPRLWSFKKGETLYSINLIPFGGYVKIFGENPDDESIAGPDSRRSFVHKPRYIQALVLVAGVAMNIIFAWALITASYTIGTGHQVAGFDKYVVVTEVLKDSPAEIAGLKAGDIITALNINDKGTTQGVNENVNSEAVKQVVSNSKGQPITVSFIRGDTKETTSVIAKDGVVKDQFAIGVQMADVENTKLPFFSAIWEGAKSTYELFITTTIGTLKFFGSAFTLHANLSEVSGPVGIAGYLNQAREFGLSTLFAFVALISINLAVINLLPFPALDGGRLLFVAIEAIIRRPLNPKIANTLNLIGFAFLMILMLTITVSDISKLF